MSEERAKKKGKRATPEDIQRSNRNLQVARDVLMLEENLKGTAIKRKLRKQFAAAANETLTGSDTDREDEYEIEERRQSTRARKTKPYGKIRVGAMFQAKIPLLKEPKRTLVEVKEVVDEEKEPQVHGNEEKGPLKDVKDLKEKPDTNEELLPALPELKPAPHTSDSETEADCDSDIDFDEEDVVEDEIPCRVVSHRCIRMLIQWKTEWERTWLTETEYKQEKKNITSVTDKRKLKDGSTERLVSWKTTYETCQSLQLKTIVEYAGDIVSIACTDKNL